ncbi:DUF1534 domain-containing protein [Pseudomonas syringae]|uniref:DUF1534 domain-containing protein n=1 Tax=Pseudomonas syringae TaxID=317 RepID=A0A9Q4A2T0_PSESX|nr:DUF1534 domain-containing protein [Pseudomonas syringae]MCF5472749.1 DUF1534 domain-containing protein [Pseudomonas syringae]MCF5481395.1 DUF1534 domain-containing protein [Pseudomonas syringae]MCF5486792.1 DUF1534 domain-containing protein [Pseudomonas syringae]MCF5492710.1 DUF1534 domain-containing protein [Pseudomonas syringae]
MKRTQSVGTIVGELSFPTLQRGNALRDAPRHNCAPRCGFKAAPHHAAATPIPHAP